MTDTRTEFSKMVTSLAKPGNDILKSLTPIKCDLMHMLIGLAGEGYELLEAITSGKDHHHYIEELGDVHFYLERIAQILEIDDLRTEVVLPLEFPNIYEVMRLIGEVVDTGKKLVIYNQDKRREVLIRHTKALWYTLRRFEDLNLYDFDEILSANIHKLVGSEKARYKGGVYSDEAAQERRDKLGNYYVHHNGHSWFVKEAEFFESQGGLTHSWGKNWTPVTANSAEHAVEIAESMGIRKT